MQCFASVRPFSRTQLASLGAPCTPEGFLTDSLPCQPVSLRALDLT